MPDSLPQASLRAFTGQPLLPQGFALPEIADQTALPLQGVTLLAVEDSRFASEALRLMCLRAGARLRRAETLAAARAHLRVYRPDVVIVDLGLPDGNGEGLIRSLMLSKRRPLVILGTSGNEAGRGAALAAGADGFLDKPLESFSKFCDILQGLLPGVTGASPEESVVTPDPLALQDDLSQAAAALSAQPDGPNRRYLARFVKGLAQCSHDTALARAASAAEHGVAGLDPLRHLLDRRLNRAGAAFPGSNP